MLANYLNNLTGIPSGDHTLYKTPTSLKWKDDGDIPALKFD